MGDLESAWRLVGGVVTAWFDAPSLAVGAELAGRVVRRSPDAAVDIRATGVRVRLGSAEDATAVSADAHDLGLTADPAVLQHLSVVLESPDPSAVTSFWQRALGYAVGTDGELVDPLRRDPTMRVRPATERRPLRHRVHLDVVRPAASVEQAGLGEPFGPYGVCHADADGNEVDLVPGDPLGGSSDWQAVFGAVVCYRTTSPAQQGDVAAASATLASDAGFPLLIDLRPGLVILDSGKDRWEADAHGLDLDFADLARDVQAAAQRLGATPDPALPRFVQVLFDAADVEAVRAFWVGALGYERDRRSGPTDINDPRWLNPVLLFQELDPADTARQQQRNRIHVELAVPTDVAAARVATAVDAGGRVVDEAAGRWRIADPEGNELVIVSGP